MRLVQPASARWQTIPALLFTGKLACLLAALLILALGALAYGLRRFVLVPSRRTANVAPVPARPA